MILLTECVVETANEVRIFARVGNEDRRHGFPDAGERHCHQYSRTPVSKCQFRRISMTS